MLHYLSFLLLDAVWLRTLRLSLLSGVVLRRNVGTFLTDYQRDRILSAGDLLLLDVGTCLTVCHRAISAAVVDTKSGVRWRGFGAAWRGEWSRFSFRRAGLILNPLFCSFSRKASYLDLLSILVIRTCAVPVLYPLIVLKLQFLICKPDVSANFLKSASVSLGLSPVSSTYSKSIERSSGVLA